MLFFRGGEDFPGCVVLVHEVFGWITFYFINTCSEEDGGEWNVTV